MKRARAPILGYVVCAISGAIVGLILGWAL